LIVPGCRDFRVQSVEFYGFAPELHLNGARFGYKADEDSPTKVLERETSASDRAVPLWGQAGDFLIELPGRPASAP
jgi:hypothetical protein